MQKSIVATRKLKTGKIIQRQDLDIKSPGGGLPPYEINNLIGKKLNKN